MAEGTKFQTTCGFVKTVVIINFFNPVCALLCCDVLSLTGYKMPILGRFVLGLGLGEFHRDLLIK